MDYVTRSVLGAKLQTSQLLGLPFAIPQHATLNEKLNINPSIAIPDTVIPTVKYGVIGNGGHRMVSGTDGISYPDVIQHLPRHTGLYNQLPFALREPTDDFTVAEISKYRLRTLVTINGVQYVAYYGKELDLSSTVPELYYYSVANGVTTATSFAPNSSDLNPTPPSLSSTGVVETTGDYIAASAQVPFKMSQADIEEFENVCKIMYGSTNYAMISEIGLCAGMDKQVNVSLNGNNVTITEAVGVVITGFIAAFYPAKFCTTGIDIALNVGALETMLASS